MFRGIVTRAQWGALPAARAVARAPFTAGAGIHYGGPPPLIRNHDDCALTVRGYQRFHIRDRGWADIAYSFLVCQHGWAFEGRGWWGKVAAHDDGNPRDGNENALYRAFCWLGGAGQTPTDDALDAFRALIAEGRRLGAGDAIEPHLRLMPGHTLCPGAPLVAAIDRGDLDPRRTPAAPPAPTPQPARPAPTPEDEMPYPPTLKLGANADHVRILQGVLVGHGYALAVDGDFGSKTLGAVRSFQASRRIAIDGSVGPVTWRHLLNVA